MQCAILVGGLGTRLGHLTKECPKPLLPVNERPYLEYLIENLIRFGFDHIVLLSGYKAELVRSFTDSLNLNIKIDVVTEPEPAGTAGALWYAQDILEDEFLLMNGDSFLDINYLDLISAPSSDDVIGHLALRTVADGSRFGVVNMHSSGFITGWQEKSDTNGPALINGGIYWLKKSVFDYIPQGKVSLENDVFPVLVREGRLKGREYSGFFIDIGVPEDYERAQSCFPIRRPAIFFDRDGVLNHDDGYTHRPEDLRWIDGAPQAVKWANDNGYFAFVVTNQAGVAKGHYTEDKITVFHDYMQGELKKLGAHIDEYKYCPHHIDGVVAEYSKECSWRKPNAGMLEALMDKWPVIIEESLMIGDKESDIEAGKSKNIMSRKYLSDKHSLIAQVRGI